MKEAERQYEPFRPMLEWINNPPHNQDASCTITKVRKGKRRGENCIHSESSDNEEEESEESSDAGTFRG